MILVTGATGRTGQEVVSRLLTDGARVRVLTRATSSVPASWTRVERALGDLEDAASLERAMKGVDAVFLLSPMDPELDRFERNAYAAAERARVRHVVKMSTTKPEEDSPIPWWRAHWRSEQALRQTGLRWTILRPNGIMFFLLQYADSVRDEGVMRTAGGDGRMALIDASDIAAAASRIFIDPSSYTGETLDLTGPRAVSYGDVAAILAEILRKPVRHEDVTPEEGRRLLGDGMRDWEVEGTIANWLMTRDGSGGFDRITDTVERLTGVPPQDVRVFLTNHAALFGGATAAQEVR